MHPTAHRLRATLKGSDGSELGRVDVDFQVNPPIRIASPAHLGLIGSAVSPAGTFEGTSTAHVTAYLYHVVDGASSLEGECEANVDAQAQTWACTETFQLQKGEAYVVVAQLTLNSEVTSTANAFNVSRELFLPLIANAS